MDRNEILKKVKTRWLAHDLVVLEEVDSTNSQMGRLFAEGRLKDGAAVIARRQTAGRGRFGRAWHSEGGLCMSVAVELKEPSMVTLATGVGVVKGLAALCGKDFFLKYPNDIISASENGRKIGGMLAELKTRGETRVAIIGIGLNVAQDSFPPELAETAASLKLLGIATDAQSVAVAALNALEPELDRVRAGDLAAVRREWLKHECTLGRKVAIRNITPPVEGLAVELDESGALVVETAEGRKRITAGDVLMEDEPQRHGDTERERTTDKLG